MKLKEPGRLWSVQNKEKWSKYRTLVKNRKEIVNFLYRKFLFPVIGYDHRGFKEISECAGFEVGKNMGEKISYERSNNFHYWHENWISTALDDLFLLMEIILITWVENMDYMEEAQKRTQVKTKNFRLNSSGDVCWMNLKGDVKMDHMRVKVEQKSEKFVR